MHVGMLLCGCDRWSDRNKSSHHKRDILRSKARALLSSYVLHEDSERSTPPASSPQAGLPAPSPPLPVLQGVAPALLRSPPTRSGNPVSLPDRHSAPETRCSHPAAISPGPPSDTSAFHPLRTGPPQTAPPSIPAGSCTLAPPPRRLCTTPHLPLPAPAPLADPICRSVRSKSVAQSADSQIPPDGNHAKLRIPLPLSVRRH